MRVVLSCENFDGFGGTETYTLTVAQQLEGLGHDVSIYSPNRGAIARFAREEGVRVLGLDELPPECDLLLFGDAATCHELAPRFRDAARVFVAHSADHDLQAPPQIPGHCHAVVVLSDRVGRAVEARAWHAPVVRLRQPIDTARFRNLGAPRPRARRVLVLSNYVSGVRWGLIEQACRANGLELCRVGGATSQTARPENAIADVDLVIGLGRCVLEGMAAARPAYVYGFVGGDGWVTPERYAAMEADGFAGLGDNKLTVDGARLREDLGRWDPMMGQVNRDIVFANHEARDHAIELVNLAQGVTGMRSFEPSPADEMAHLVRRQWQSYTRAVAAWSEAEWLRSRLAELEQDVAATHAELARVHAEREQDVAAAQAQLARLGGQLRELRETRRYRLACMFARPLDRFREGLNAERR